MKKKTLKIVAVIAALIVIISMIALQFQQVRYAAGVERDPTKRQPWAEIKSGRINAK